MKHEEGAGILAVGLQRILLPTTGLREDGAAEAGPTSEDRAVRGEAKSLSSSPPRWIRREVQCSQLLELCTLFINTFVGYLSLDLSRCPISGFPPGNLSRLYPQLRWAAGCERLFTTLASKRGQQEISGPLEPLWQFKATWTSEGSWRLLTGSAYQPSRSFILNPSPWGRCRVFWTSQAVSDFLFLLAVAGVEFILLVCFSVSK